MKTKFEIDIKQWGLGLLYVRIKRLAVQRIQMILGPFYFEVNR